MKINTELNKKRGKRLKECRKYIPGMTQEQLANLSHYSIQHISMIENGKRGMSLEAARVFSALLDIREKYLLCEDDYRTNAEESDAFNVTSTSDCRHQLKYLETLGITVMPVVPHHINNASKEHDSSYNISDIGLMDQNGKEYNLIEMPELQYDMHKDMRAFIYQYFPDDSPLLFLVRLKNKNFYILNVQEFGRFLKEIDNFVNFASRNFLENHISGQEAFRDKEKPS
ncbi:MAG: helix-turn-helix transcriptional regulator [Ruminococcus sp.]|nr:helix-turn-helix transcriptional regulator [Ruminococcus sp.]